MASPAFQPPPPPALDAYNQPLPPPLSLKVMRLSRPSLAHAGSQQLFFEVPPGGSEVDGSEPLIALERRARMSLDNVGKLPEASSEVLSSQAGMRDFPLGPLLVLPGSFGSICLGEVSVLRARDGGHDRAAEERELNGLYLNLRPSWRPSISPTTFPNPCLLSDFTSNSRRRQPRSRSRTSGVLTQRAGGSTQAKHWGQR